MCAAGSVRSPFDKGNLTMEDILTTLPFSNTYDAVSLQGRYIREALELSVSRLNSSGGGDWGGFLHVSGLQVIGNLNNKVGDRIVSITVIEDEAALEDNRMYNLVLFDHLLRGGYRYQMIHDNHKSRIIGDLDTDIIKYEFTHFSPVFSKIEGRITFVQFENVEEVTQFSDLAMIVMGAVVFMSILILVAINCCVKYLISGMKKGILLNHKINDLYI